VDNTGAAYLYRKRIKTAIDNYTRAIRETWEQHGSPIPVTQEVASVWVNAWGSLRVAWAKADMLLEQDRRTIGGWADDGGRNLE
jgi:hypothetical protein